jgi:ribosome recycling factor
MDQTKFDKIIEHFEKELSNIRTGRAMPSIVENIMVESYGVKTPLNQLASINVAEPQTLSIQPWDRSIIKDIEKGIRMANLDLNPVVTENIVRINFPSLTEEKRKELVKIVSRKAEEAKIGIRGVREEEIKFLKKQEKDKAISEDERFRQEKDLQEVVDKYQKKIQIIQDKKEKDLLTI